MKSKTGVYITVIILLAALARPGQLAAQESRYKLIDLGTPGGPNTYASTAGTGFRVLNDAGTVAGWGDTTTPDPTCLNDPYLAALDGSCQLAHVFRWQNGSFTDLGALPGVNTSNVAAINAGGWILGASGNGLIDPVSGLQQVHGVLWKADQITDLGTLEGGNIVLPQTLNNAGQVVGEFENTVPDPFSLFGFPTQTRAFLWQNGVMQDLGTLGGPDALASSINERGQVVGQSYTNDSPNINTTIPTLEPFLWENGKMISLGTLGGTIGGPDPHGSMLINNRGQITANSNLAGDTSTHAFVWENGVMTDLGTLGGVNSYPLWLNDVGEIVGAADLTGSAITHLHHAFLWKNRVMMDLGTLGSTSVAEAVNSRGQVVGRSKPGKPSSILQHAFLWEDGGPMVDLNTVIPANSGLQLIDAVNINDSGEILAVGLPLGVAPAKGVGHLVLLIPCDAAAGEDCSPVVANATQNNGALSSKQTTSSSLQLLTHPQGPAAWLARLVQRANLLGAATPKD